MNRELSRVMAMILAGFGLVILSTAFWSIFERDNLMRREDNARRVLAELNIQRGTIFDRNGEPIAYSQPNTLGMERIYPYPEVVSATGHYSYQYGESGIEEFAAVLLRGDDLRDHWEILRDDFVHRPVRGADIQTTIDLNLQIALAQALEGRNGAGIIVHVPSGEVLAMVSVPSYDPNLVDEQFEKLEEIRGRSPLLNRVTTGDFQPGGVLQTLMLSELLSARIRLDTDVSGSDVRLTNPRLTLTCPTEDSVITLAEAYLLSCPAPFVEALGTRVSVAAFEEKLRVAGLMQSPSLYGFNLETEPRPVAIGTLYEEIAAAAAGQGELTVTPLQMVQVIAALVNEGSGVPLQIAHSYRLPDSRTWELFELPNDYPAEMQPEIAQTIRDLLEQHPLSDEFPLYGHSSHAYAGTRDYSWFLGWTPLQNENGYAVVVIVVERSEDQPDAADIAVKVMPTAYTLEIAP